MDDRSQEGASSAGLAVEKDTAREGAEVLGRAIGELLAGAQAHLHDLPQNDFQMRLRFAASEHLGRDISALATAAVVLLRRAGTRFPPASEPQRSL
jgi:hypothetical protein